MNEIYFAVAVHNLTLCHLIRACMFYLVLRGSESEQYIFSILHYTIINMAHKKLISFVETFQVHVFYKILLETCL